jgi:putative transposase
VEEDGPLPEADEEDGRVLRKGECGGIGWGWQAMDSKHSAAPLGGEKTGKNPTDRGKSGAKINLLVDGRGAPISVVLTGANRHDKISAMELIVSVVLKRPGHKDLREFVDSAGYIEHISRSIPGKKAPSVH